MYAKAMMGISPGQNSPPYIRLKTVYDRNEILTVVKKNSQDCQECLGNAALFFWGRQSFTMQHRFSFGSCTWAQLVKYIERDNSEQFKVMFL